MKRSNFLKALFTLVAAPSILGELKPIEPFDENKPVITCDRIVFHAKKPSSFRIGDLIVSDMPDRAVITSIISVTDTYHITARSLTGTFRYKDINSIRCFAQAYSE